MTSFGCCDNAFLLLFFGDSPSIVATGNGAVVAGCDNLVWLRPKEKKPAPSPLSISFKSARSLSLEEASGLMLRLRFDDAIFGFCKNAGAGTSMSSSSAVAKSCVGRSGLEKSSASASRSGEMSALVCRAIAFIFSASCNELFKPLSLRPRFDGVWLVVVLDNIDEAAESGGAAS